jgi:conjugal transfer/entry exclusion protein
MSQNMLQNTALDTNRLKMTNNPTNRVIVTVQYGDEIRTAEGSFDEYLSASLIPELIIPELIKSLAIVAWLSSR